VGVGWIGLDFAAQSVDVDLQHVALSDVFAPPYML
jgi:hypothetical protein